MEERTSEPYVNWIGFSPSDAPTKELLVSHFRFCFLTARYHTAFSGSLSSPLHADHEAGHLIKFVQNEGFLYILVIGILFFFPLVIAVETLIWHGVCTERAVHCYLLAWDERFRIGFSRVIHKWGHWDRLQDRLRGDIPFRIRLHLIFHPLLQFLCPFPFS